MNRRIIAILVAAVCLGGTLEIPAFAGLTVKGDQAAWVQIATAYANLYKLLGFKARWMSGQSTLITVEVAPPVNYHSVRETDSGTLETIRVGNEYRIRNLNAPTPHNRWECPSNQQQLLALENPGNIGDPREDALRMGTSWGLFWDLQGTVEANAGNDTVINEVPVRTYTYTIALNKLGPFPIPPGKPLSLKGTLYVAKETGLPIREIQLWGKAHPPGAEVVWAYYDLGDPVNITLPPCE